MPEIKYDWVMLKDKWFKSEELELSAFLEKEIGKRPDRDGNVNEHTKGWIEEKKLWKQNRNDEIQKQVDQDLIKKLKVPLTESLAIRNMLSQVDLKLLGIFLRIGSEENPPTDKELQFLKAFPDKLQDVWKRVQIELGLPTNVSELQGSEEKPLYFRDLIKKAEEINKRNADRERTN